MIEVYRGSAQPWECDATGHMNVRFYMSRVADGLSSLASELGAGRSHERRLGRGLVAVEHHLRFHHEVLPAAPLLLEAAVLDAHRYGLRAYFELRNAVDEEPAATAVAETRYLGLATREATALPDDVERRAAALAIVIPERGRPRGISTDLPRAAPTSGEADELGLVQVYRSVVRGGHCDTHGYMTPEALIACLSDGVPNLWACFHGEDRSRQPGQGGAALEYRLVYRSMPRVGDLISVRSGLRGLGEKTLHFAHWIFDVESGKAIATAEVISVSLDLESRRALRLSADLRQQLEGRIVPSLSL